MLIAFLKASIKSFFVFVNSITFIIAKNEGKYNWVWEFREKTRLANDVREPCYGSAKPVYGT